MGIYFRQLVNSIIYPKITYAAFIWADALKYQYNLKPIRTLSYLCSKKICKAYRTTSKAASQLISGTLPLETVIIKYALIELAKRGNIIPEYIQEYSQADFTSVLVKTIETQNSLARSNYKKGL